MAGGEDKSVRLWEVATGKQRVLLDGHRNLVRTGVFSADGKMLATGSDDTTALVWDLTGRLGDESEWDKPLAAADLDACWTALVRLQALIWG